MAEVKEILMFSTIRVNRSNIPECITFWPILNFIEVFRESLNKTPIPKPEMIFFIKNKESMSTKNSAFKANKITVFDWAFVIRE